MTEQEWLECADAQKMLEFLQDKASERKLRLFASGCCRRLWSHFKDERSGKIVEVSESVADGIASANALAIAFDAATEAQEAIHWQGGDAVDQSAAEAVLGLREGIELNQVLEGTIEAAGAISAREAWKSIYGTPGRHWTETEAEHNEATRLGEEAERNTQAVLLRDIFGNPFRPITIDPAWLSWRDGTVPKIAKILYEERRFQDLPILADALEEAGCTNADVLNHCRSEGPHVRGCGVVDLLLGKQ